MLTLSFITPLFYYLPSAVPAAICGLINFLEPIKLVKVKKVDGWTLLSTLAGTLHGMILSEHDCPFA
ncbi:hypothetical protein BH23ACT11_BH23ACT11_28480 [soil metagenome]